MTPKDRRKGTFPLWNDEIRRNAATLRARVRDVVDGNAAAMFHAGFLNIQRRVGIVVEGVGGASVLREQGRRGKKKDEGDKSSHDASPWSVKGRLIPSSKVSEIPGWESAKPSAPAPTCGQNWAGRPSAAFILRLAGDFRLKRFVRGVLVSGCPTHPFFCRRVRLTLGSFSTNYSIKAATWRAALRRRRASLLFCKK